MNADLQPGKLINQRYRVVSALGEGGMGTVYRVTDMSLKRDVALKLLKDQACDPETIKRVERESRALASLEHPAVVFAYHTGWQVLSDFGPKRPFIAMELVEGQSVSSVVEDRGPLGWRDCCSLTLQIVSALQAVHSAGVTHRDIKPANIMIVGDLPEARVKIIDFGLCRMSDMCGQRQVETLTSTGCLLGSVHYMSPEACSGEKTGPAGDTYSLGCSIYFMLTGTPPFTADEGLGVLYKHGNEKAMHLRELDVTNVPVELETLVFEMLEKDPDKRPPLSKIAEKLQELLNEQSPLLISETAKKSPIKKRKSKIWLATSATLLSLTIAFLLTSDAAVAYGARLVAGTVSPPQLLSLMDFLDESFSRLGGAGQYSALSKGLLDAQLQKYSSAEKLQLYKSILTNAISRHDGSVAQLAGIKVLEESNSLITGKSQAPLPAELLETALIEASTYFNSANMTRTECAAVCPPLTRLRASAKELSSRAHRAINAAVYPCYTGRRHVLSAEETKICIDAQTQIINRPSNERIDPEYAQAFERKLALLSTEAAANNFLADTKALYSVWLSSSGRTKLAVAQINGIEPAALAPALADALAPLSTSSAYTPEEKLRICTFLELQSTTRQHPAYKILSRKILNQLCMNLENGNANLPEAPLFETVTYLNTIHLNRDEATRVIKALLHIGNRWSTFSPREIIGLQDLLCHAVSSGGGVSSKEVVKQCLLDGRVAVLNCKQQSDYQVHQSYGSSLKTLTAIGDQEAQRMLTLEYAQWLYEHDDIDELLLLTNEAGNCPANAGDRSQLNSGRNGRASGTPREQLHLYRFMLAKLRGKNVQFADLVAMKLLTQSLTLLPSETTASMKDGLFDSSVNAACTYLRSAPLTARQRTSLLSSLSVLRLHQASLSMPAKLNFSRLMLNLASNPGHDLTPLERSLSFEAQHAIATYGLNPALGCSCKEMDEAFRYCLDSLQHHPDRSREHGYIVSYADFLFSYGKAKESLKLLKRLDGVELSNSNANRYNIARTKVEFSARNYRWCAANVLFNGPPSAQLATMYYRELYTALRIGISRSRTGAVSEAIAMCNTLRDSRAMVKAQLPVDWFSIEDQENVFLIESGKPASAAAQSAPQERYGKMYSKALAFLKLGRWKEAIAETPADIEKSKFDNLSQSEHITAGFVLDFATIRFESNAAIGNQAEALAYLSQVFHHYVDRRDKAGIFGYPDPERILRARSTLVKMAQEGFRTGAAIGLADNILAGLGCRLPAK